MNTVRATIARPRRGFSLLEVLLATFILGIGLIMVASVFPVGANWTREGMQDSIAQTIALNALSVIQTHYGPGSLDPEHKPGSTQWPLSKVNGSNTLSPLPGFAYNSAASPASAGIPLCERCYQFGSTQPFPAQNPSVCLYYWTALARPTPGSGGASHDIYVFVFRKGEATQRFTRNVNPPGSPPALVPGAGYVPYVDSSNTYPYTEMPGLRDTVPNPPGQSSPPTLPVPAYYTKYNGAYYDWALEPTLVRGQYNHGTYNSARNPPVQDAFPPIGFIGVGETTGTVFRQTLHLDFTTANLTYAMPSPDIYEGSWTPNLPLSGLTPPPENVIFAPAADDAPGSPLVYVYQTTVSY
ncbi:MAG TPA: prepilin-type N-terminal cleavage/methylation domain-containing protein [Phycisphaerae bacterium]|nr:prepilin-type N-terminal cleavage/methylation domain-containing protein [Phycisphaerae bacterium]